MTSPQALASFHKYLKNEITESKNLLIASKFTKKNSDLLVGLSLTFVM